ncbi:MAG: 1-deoxy-D-xylulose-5-phosphate synthase [Candidatus Neoclostridium sp.]
MSLIEQVNNPGDLKKLSLRELDEYAAEVREKIIDSVSNRGGHLASNLGAVELTIALHYVFDCPDDSILFDTGHQAYTHKIITGRAKDFDRLRTDGGISGMERKTESRFDAYTAGHSGNSLSIALGLLRARKKAGKKGYVVAVIGDGALTSGMTYEALNDLGASGDNLIIVLNDNKMSISENVGAMSQYLAKLRISPKYADFKCVLKKFCYAIPFVGEKLYAAADNAKTGLKSWLIGNSLFESMGISYYGPFNGHDIKNMVKVFRAAKERNKPAILHVVTEKGRGYKRAEDNPRGFHGVAPPDKSAEKSFSAVFGEKLCQMAQKNGRITAVTAAMTDGVGLTGFAEAYPDRFFDAGIAEQHATDMAVGMAIGGLKPYFAVYSSFFQRAADQVVVDACIDKLPVTFIVDHAGFVEGDGITHQGVYDLSMLSGVDGLIIASPMDGEHLKNLLDFSEKADSPMVIRYPKSYARDIDIKDKSVTAFKWNTVRKTGSKSLILVHDSETLSIALETDGADITFATFIKPLDEEFLNNSGYERVIVVENGLISGGLGQSVQAYFMQNGINIKVTTIGFDSVPDCYNKKYCFEKYGITAENLNNIINNG